MLHYVHQLVALSQLLLTHLLALHLSHEIYPLSMDYTTYFFTPLSSLNSDAAAGARWPF